MCRIVWLRIFLGNNKLSWFRTGDTWSDDIWDMILRVKMNVRNCILATRLAMMLALALGVIPAFAQQTEPHSPQQPVGAPATDPQDPPDEVSTESMFPHSN